MNCLKSQQIYTSLRQANEIHYQVSRTRNWPRNQIKQINNATHRSMKFSILWSFSVWFYKFRVCLPSFSQYLSISIWIAVADDKRYSNKLEESEEKKPLFVDLIPGYRGCYWFLLKSSYSTCRDRDEASHNNEKKDRFEIISIYSLYNTSFCRVNDGTRHFSEIISIKLNYKPFESVRRWAQIYAIHCAKERESKKVSCSPLTGEWWSLISHFCLHG